MGSSYLGGCPDVPDGFAWPTASRRRADGEPIALPLAFVGQIALTDLSEHDRERLLPTTGLLSFFVLDLGRMLEAAPASRLDPGAPDLVCVRHFPLGASLTRSRTPEAVPDCERFDFRVLTFAAATSWPLVEGNALRTPSCPTSAPLELDASQADAWAEAAPENPPCQLLGHPAGCEFPIGQDPRDRLLLSIDAELAGVPWSLCGRNGLLFLRMSEEAMRAGRFEEVRCKQW